MHCNTSQIEMTHFAWNLVAYVLMLPVIYQPQYFWLFRRTCLTPWYIISNMCDFSLHLRDGKYVAMHLNTMRCNQMKSKDTSSQIYRTSSTWAFKKKHGLKKSHQQCIIFTALRGFCKLRGYHHQRHHHIIVLMMMMILAELWIHAEKI